MVRNPKVHCLVPLSIQYTCQHGCQRRTTREPDDAHKRAMRLHILQHIRHAQHQTLDRVCRPKITIPPSPGVEVWLRLRATPVVGVVPGVAGRDAQGTRRVEELGATGVEGVREGGGGGRKGGAELSCEAAGFGLEDGTGFGVA